MVRRLKKCVDRTELLFEEQRRTWLLMTDRMHLRALKKPTISQFHLAHGGKGRKALKQTENKNEYA